MPCGLSGCFKTQPHGHSTARGAPTRPQLELGILEKPFNSLSEDDLALQEHFWDFQIRSSAANYDAISDTLPFNIYQNFRFEYVNEAATNAWAQVLGERLSTQPVQVIEVDLRKQNSARYQIAQFRQHDISNALCSAATLKPLIVSLTKLKMKGI